MTQIERILNYIEEHGMVDRVSAAYDLGIFELSSRICELEDKGFIFDKQSVVRKNRYGDKFRCTEYRIIGRQ